MHGLKVKTFNYHFASLPECPTHDVALNVKEAIEYAVALAYIGQEVAIEVDGSTVVVVSWRDD